MIGSENPQTGDDGTGYWYRSSWVLVGGHWYILTDVWYVIDYCNVAYFYYLGYNLDWTC